MASSEHVPNEFQVDYSRVRQTPGYDLEKLSGEVTIQNYDVIPKVVSPGHIENIVFDSAYLADVVEGDVHRLEEAVDPSQVSAILALYRDDAEEQLTEEFGVYNLEDSIEAKDFPEMVGMADDAGINTYRLSDMNALLESESELAADERSRLDWIQDNTDVLYPDPSIDDPVDSSVFGAGMLESLTVYVNSRKRPSNVIDRDIERNDLLDISPQVMYRWLKSGQDDY